MNETVKAAAFDSLRAAVDELVSSATFAKQVLRSQHNAYGDIAAREACRDLGMAIAKVVQASAV